MTAGPSNQGAGRLLRPVWWDVPAAVWALGLVLALVIMGPALAPGPLLNLDLVAVPDPPVPRGTWGLGPELPRRVPMWVPVAWLAPLVGGDTVVKVLMVAGLMLAFAGMYRYLQPFGCIAALAAATLFAGNPFMVTRLAVGHLHVVGTAAVLPWALRDLLAPDRSLRRTFLWSAALGVSGIFGGSVAGLLVVIGLVAARRRRAPAVLAATVVAQLPWFVPLAVVTAVSGPELADAGSFGTRMVGVEGVGALVAGHGFWNPAFQVGGSLGWPVAVAGFALLGLAGFGSPALPRREQGGLLALAAIGFFASAATALPGLDGAMTSFSRTALGAPFREPQRLLVLFLVWLAPAAAIGARRLARLVAGYRARTAAALAVAAVPLVLAAYLVAPGAWGAGGQLAATPYPEEWAVARDVVQAEPGTVVALPWHQYFTFDVARNRLVLNTAPLYFGGDVIVSSDPEIGPGRSGRDARERGDARELVVERSVRAMQQGEAVGADLRRLGVRWVVLMKDVDWRPYERALAADAAFERRVDGPTLALYELRDWPGWVTTDEGAAVGSSTVASPLFSVDGSGSARLAVPGTAGWRRGVARATPTDDGLVQLPGGSGPVWYWPAVVVLAADVLWAALLVIALRRRRSVDQAGDTATARVTG